MKQREQFTCECTCKSMNLSGNGIFCLISCIGKDLDINVPKKIKFITEKSWLNAIHRSSVQTYAYMRQKGTAKFFWVQLCQKYHVDIFIE